MVVGELIVDYICKVVDGVVVIIVIGFCLVWGGVVVVGVNLIGVVSLQEVLLGKMVINISGCLLNLYNFLVIVVYIIIYGMLLKLDVKNCLIFVYGCLIYEYCECCLYFDVGCFVKEFGDEGYCQGWCFYYFGCKGLEIWGNCFMLQFCDVGGVWLVVIGYFCYGCNEEGIGFYKGIYQFVYVEN